MLHTKLILDIKCAGGKCVGGKQRNNLAIFGPFLDLQEFFKNRGLSFETSDYNLCGLLNELFHMNIKNFFEKKSKLQKLF